MFLNELINIYVKKYRSKGIPDAFKEIRFIIEELIKLPLSSQLSNESLYLNKKIETVLKKTLNRRLKREPLERIFNKKTFRDFELTLNSSTFSPRQETELLIDIVISLNVKPKSILELGTGTGAINIALMKKFPNTKSVATDVNIRSIKLAKKNAIKNNVVDQITFICCNWVDFFVNSDFDLIIANPPYIRTEVIKSLDPEVKYYDPFNSLDGGIDGLSCYREIILGLGPKLSNKTIIIFEIGYDQAQSVIELMKEENIMQTKVFKDYSNHPRFVLGTKNKTIL